MYLFMASRWNWLEPTANLLFQPKEIFIIRAETVLFDWNINLLHPIFNLNFQQTLISLKTFLVHYSPIEILELDGECIYACWTIKSAQIEVLAPADITRLPPSIITTKLPKYF
jgi:hypothetical protein